MKYRGLVIGGELAGQYMEHDANMLRIPKHGEIITRSDGTRAAYQPHLYDSYIFVTRYWWPYDVRKGIPSLTEILDTLDRSYVQRHQALAAQVEKDK